LEELLFLDLRRNDNDYLRLETDRTLYHAGESVTVRVQVMSPKNTPPNQTIVIHAMSEIPEGHQPPSKETHQPGCSS
jgi:hypothetical protein